ncbi:hypothetical protein [Cellulosimicrobium aquatile]|uniref:hypothetical protein n=1 Tax=Cellulosimicrobium aquatile TaxID=1612203 RepID=UPI0014597D54|nr:hypothetical protein [Cellulosimicrobium aquatile]NMF27928.1 hypothetical protein [Cellulosimicrobium aquatile]
MSSTTRDAVPTAVVDAAEAARERTPDGAPRFSLLRDVIEPALLCEHRNLEQARENVASTWRGLDIALRDEELAREAIEQLERARAQLVADQIEREQAAATTEVCS